jgi:hypothetical protein
MAFRNSNAQRNDDRDQQGWKAAGFINMYLPMKRSDGSIANVKLNAVPLKADTHKALLDLLTKDPEGTIEKIKQHLILDFRPANVNEGAVFAFGE